MGDYHCRFAEASVLLSDALGQPAVITGSKLVDAKAVSVRSAVKFTQESMGTQMFLVGFRPASNLAGVANIYNNKIPGNEVVQTSPNSQYQKQKEKCMTFQTECVEDDDDCEITPEWLDECAATLQLIEDTMFCRGGHWGQEAIGNAQGPAERRNERCKNMFGGV